MRHEDVIGASEPVEPGLAPEEARDWLALQRSMAWNPESVGEQVRAGLPPEAILSVVNGVSASDTDLERDVEKLERVGARVLPLTHSDYPPALAALVDAPLVLLVKGSVPALFAPSVAIVGARAATRIARETARRLARELASAGFTIVSGLARGIDAEAHRGALEGRGSTVGVLACGLDRIYPPEHRSLANDMSRDGAVISEMPLGVAPRRAHFSLRNRIISGLCVGVVVVEARRRSGSLITVRHALGQGREVFVVPGSIEGPFAEGSNGLLRDGARPIRCARDVIEDLGLPVTAGRSDMPTTRAAETAGSGSADGTRLEARLLAALAAGPARREDLLTHADFDACALATALLELELLGRVVEERDGRIHAVWS
jgi:DNA processing protein